jgi:hypothetical protein
MQEVEMGGLWFKASTDKHMNMWKWLWNWVMNGGMEEFCGEG